MRHATGGIGRPGRFVGAALTAVLAFAYGCASFGGGSDEQPPRKDYRNNPVTVRVQNLNWQTVHVYAVAGGQSSSLGIVSSQSDETFEVPATILGSREFLRLAADPVGSRGGFLSEEILIRPGDRIEWTVKQPLVHSSVMVK